MPRLHGSHVAGEQPARTESRATLIRHATTERLRIFAALLHPQAQVTMSERCRSIGCRSWTFGCELLSGNELAEGLPEKDTDQDTLPDKCWNRNT